MKHDEVIHLPGFTWRGQNRTLTPGAIRGSGGVGFLIRESLLSLYNVYVMDSTFEGILWIKLVHKEYHHTSVMFCSIYLPPEGSCRGNTAHEFYDTLLSQVYAFSNGDPMFIL